MNLRMHVIDAVFKRNFLSYFSGVIGYLFIFLFVVLESWVAFNSQFFANNLANLDQLNAVFPMLLLVFVPAITMSAWSEEKKLGTDELLFTLPASDLEILLGKYAALVGVYTVALFFSLFQVLVLWYLGKPDMGLMFTTYFGYWLAGCALLSAGMLGSVLTSSATVAYVLGALFCAIPVFFDKFAPPVINVLPLINRLLPGFTENLSRLAMGLSVSEQMRDFSLGMVSLGSLLYFVSLTVVMLYLNLVFISRRHWSGGPNQAPMWAHFLARAVALTTILICANTVAFAKNPRWDLTKERLYSVTPTTQKVISELKSDRPVLVQAFVSPEVPPELIPARTNLIGLLRQFANEGGDKLRVRIVKTEKFTDQAEEARRYGIDSVEITDKRNGRTVRDDVFLGVVITSVDEQVVVPFFDKGTPVEYELTRSIRTVAQSKRKTVGILNTDAKVGGGFDMQTFRQSPEWRVAQELKKQYEVKPVGPEELATSNVDVLIAVMPSSLTDPEMQHLLEYVNRGKPTLIIDDPLPVLTSVQGLAPHQKTKPRPGGMMGMMGGGGGPPQQKADDGKATRLMNALGIFWDSEQIVGDRYCSHPEVRDWLTAMRVYDVVFVAAQNKARFAFNQESPITRGMQEVMMFYPGTIKPREGSKLKFDPLLRSSPESVTYEWKEYVRSQEGPFGGGGMELIRLPPKDPSLDQTSPVIAARITGTAAGSGDKTPSINVVFIADMDMVADPLFFIREKEWNDLKLDNIAFVLNAVDELAGEEALLTLRSRNNELRTLTTLEQKAKAFKELEDKESAKADEKAEKALETARQGLQDEVDKIRDDKTLDQIEKIQRVAMAEQSKNREFEVAKAKIETEKNRTLKEVKDGTEREIRGIENWTRMWAIVLPPVPPLLLGIFILSLRVQRERQGIVPDRLVHKK